MGPPRPHGSIDDNVGPCKDGGGGGLVLPSWHQFEDEKLKVVIYGVGLCYCFLGVSIVADMFMSAIERITSKKNVIHLPSGRTVTSQVWNDSVANLTLMALGSSAPEILLSLNDIFKNEFFESALGPSTIVGSAAFNLFVIIAVCINSLPDGETRQIKEMGVFAITAAFSLLAYLWLLFIVQFNSKDIIEPAEGVATFTFFPILVIISYGADVGWFKNVPGFRLLPSSQNDEDSSDHEDPELDDMPRRNPLDCVVGCVCMPCFRCKRLFTRGGASDEEASTEDHEAAAVIDHSKPILDEFGEPLKSEFGIITFEGDQLEVTGTDEPHDVTIGIHRKNGTSGRVSVQYSMERLTAMPGFDYEDASGELNFRDGVDSAEISVTVLPKRPGERADKFQVILHDATGGLTFNPYGDGGKEKNLLTVTIKNGNKGPVSIKQRFYNWVDGLLNLDEVYLANEEWHEQIQAALYVNGSREEQEGASFLDWVSHVVNFPWKFPFAVTTPPPIYLGGWVCFVMSLGHIGWITIIIGDAAELFGCCAGIKDSITAITFVALGTSVPDLLASRIAAQAEEYADASIVNVTGSNSVNVFLGIGLPWMFASIYWKVTPPTQKWINKYQEHYENGVQAFIVNSGDLTFTVTIFALCAMVCISVIVVRRLKFGGELGGPADIKAYSSFLLMLLWGFYVALSIWKIEAGDVDLWLQAMVVGLAIPCFVAIMFLFAACRRVLKISKKYIGEEGFWGVLVALSIIGGRLLIYIFFQYSP